MAQFLRPDSNVTQTGVTGGFADIDESIFSDADFAYSADNTAGTLEVGLSNPSGTPGSGTCTARYRLANIDGGVLGSGGNAVTITPALYEGTTLIASGTNVTAPDAWTEYTFTFAASAVTDWTDLRLRWTCAATGGPPANRRGMGISWAEVETPDASVSYTLACDSGSVAVTGTAASLEKGYRLAADSGSLTLTGTAATLTAGSVWYAGSEGSVYVDFENDRVWNDATEYASLALWLSGTSSTFAAATPGTYFDASGVMQTAAADTIRREWDPNTGSPFLGALFEVAATNAAAYSKEIGNAYWTKGALNVTADQATAPDGTTTMDKVVEVSSGSTTPHEFYRNSLISLVSGQRYFHGVFAKAGARSNVWLKFNQGTSNYRTKLFNLSTGEVAGSASVGSSSSDVASGIIDCGDGVFFCYMIYDWSGSTVGATAAFGIYNSSTIGTPNGFGSLTYAGDGSSDAYFWGAMVINQSAPSGPLSFIHTDTTSASRSADALTIALPSGTHDLTVTFDNDTTQAFTNVSGNYAFPTFDGSLNRRHVKRIVGTLVTGYDIAAASGSLAVTGTAASLLRSHKVAAANGAFALTGTAAGLERGYTLTAESGSYSVTGTAAALERSLSLAAGSGSYNVTGADAGLLRGIKFTADDPGNLLLENGAALRKQDNGKLKKEKFLRGQYVLTGTDVGLTVSAEASVAATSGSYTLTGSAANLEHNRVLAAGSESYAATGTAASLVYGYRLAVDAGSLTSTGTAAGLEYGRLIAAGSGSYTVTGTAAGLVKAGSYTLAADAGSYAVTGTAAGLIADRTLAADSATYAVTGTAAALEQGYKVAADAGAVAVNGTAAALERGYTLTASSGAVTVTGTAATLARDYPLAAGAGSYSLNGAAASLEVGRVIDAGAGSYALTGTSVALEKTGSYNLIAESGSYGVTGTAATLKANRSLVAASGSFAVTGTDAGMEFGRRLAAGSGSIVLTGTASDLKRHRVLAVGGGAYAVTGTAAGLAYTPAGGFTIAAESGSYALSGSDVDLLFSGEGVPVGAAKKRRKPAYLRSDEADLRRVEARDAETRARRERAEREAARIAALQDSNTAALLAALMAGGKW